MKKDIESKDDIRLLINRFYEKVRIDETIGYFFSEVIPVNFEKTSTGYVRVLGKYSFSYRFLCR